MIIFTSFGYRRRSFLAHGSLVRETLEQTPYCHNRTISDGTTYDINWVSTKLYPLAITGEYARSFMRTLIDPVYASFAMEKVSNTHRSTLAGFYSTTWSIGFSIGPAVAGWLQSNVSLSTSFMFGAFCLVLAPSLLLVFFGRKQS